MSPDQPAPVPAGWYPDPHGVSELRWWDGQSWTDTVHPPVAPAPTEVPVAPAVVAPAVVAPTVVEPIVVEPIAVVPDAGLNFPPPSMMTPPQSSPADFGSPTYDLSAAEPQAAAAPVVAAPSPAPQFIEPPAPAQTEALPSRRELRERGGNAPTSALTSAPTEPTQSPDSLSPVASAATASGPADQGPADQFPAASFPPPSVPAPSAPAPSAPAPPAPTASIPDSSDPSSFDWLTGATTAADVRGETGPAPALSAWGQEPGSTEQDPEDLYSSSPTRTSTTSGWFIALMPLVAGILSIGAVKGAENYPRYIPEGVAWWMLVAGVLVLLYLVTLLLASADRRKLDWVGYSYPAHWAWALLTAPIYLIVRAASVKRETGRNSGLLWVWIVLAGALVGGWFATNYFAPELIEAYTLPFR